MGFFSIKSVEITLGQVKIPAKKITALNNTKNECVGWFTAF